MAAASDEFLTAALLTLESVPVLTDENTTESPIRNKDNCPLLMEIWHTLLNNPAKLYLQPADLCIAHRYGIV